MNIPSCGFFKVKDVLYKVYDCGDDWAVIGSNGYQRYHSQWQADRYGSLKRAIEAIPGASMGDYYDLEATGVL